jgi:hypothetical protein
LFELSLPCCEPSLLSSHGRNNKRDCRLCGAEYTSRSGSGGTHGFCTNGACSRGKRRREETMRAEKKSQKRQESPPESRKKRRRSPTSTSPLSRTAPQSPFAEAGFANQSLGALLSAWLVSQPFPPPGSAYGGPSASSGASSSSGPMAPAASAAAAALPV